MGLFLSCRVLRICVSALWNTLWECHLAFFQRFFILKSHEILLKIEEKTVSLLFSFFRVPQACWMMLRVFQPGHCPFPHILSGQALLPLANQGGPPGLCTYYLFCPNGLPSNPFLFGELLLMFQDSVQKSVLVSFSYSCHHLKEAFLTIFKIVTPAPRAPCSPPLLYFPFWHSLLLQRPYHYFICIVCHLSSVSRVQNVCCTRPRIIVIVLGSQGLAYSRCSRIVDK